MSNDALSFLAFFMVVVLVLLVPRLLKRRYPHWFYKKLGKSHRSVLEKYFQYYDRLDARQKKRFEHLVAGFLEEKEWKGVGVELEDEMQVMISASAAQLMFGLPDLTLLHFDRMLVYGDAYKHQRSGRMHQGEVNPGAGIIRLSWKHYLHGYARPEDAHNVALHEMAHALWFEDIIPNVDDDFFDLRVFTRWKELARDEMERIQRGERRFFRAYAGTNAEEFFAVAVEYFFEQPLDFRQELPDLYDTLKQLLRQDPAASVAVRA